MMIATTIVIHKEASYYNSATVQQCNDDYDYNTPNPFLTPSNAII